MSDVRPRLMVRDLVGIVIFDQRERTVFALIGVWFLIMVSVPLLRWTVGEALFPLDIAAGVVAQLVASLAAVRLLWGWRMTAVTAGVILLCAWGIEFVGHTTGFPFGTYFYTERLQPQIGGVPILIPLAWLMMLPPAWAVAQVMTERMTGWRGRAAFIVWTALAFTAWDLFLDPQMVGWGLWVWPEPGAFSYFGIPWTNYTGWLLAATALTALVGTFAPLRKLAIRPLLVIYALTWFLETVGLSWFWGQPGPGIVGGILMGAILFTAVVHEMKKQHG